MFGFADPLGASHVVGHDREPRGALGRESLHPDKVILSGENAHYTHERLCGGDRRAARVGAAGRARAARPRRARGAPARAAASGRSWSTLGTTSLGALDDVGAVADLCEAHGARLHVDAAYGGFFALLADGREPASTRRAVRGAPARRLDRRRPAQARPAAVRLRLRAVRRPASVARLLPPRLALHVLHLTRTASRRDHASSARAPALRPRRCGRRCARCR